MKTHWFTGAVIRICDCGSDKQPPSPTLRVYTDGKDDFAHCQICKRTWNVRTMKQVLPTPAR